MMFQLPVPGAGQTRREKCLDHQGTNYGSKLPTRQSRVESRDHVNDVVDDNNEEEELNNIKIRTSRSRLKDRLNWFSSRSRQRLSSFGSSDNLKYVRDSFLRSRDKLSCALSPVRGSYQFVDTCDFDKTGSEGRICTRVAWQ